MKEDNFLGGLLERLQFESKSRIEEDLSTYLDLPEELSAETDDEEGKDEKYLASLKRPQFGRNIRDSLRYTSGKTGSNVTYNINYEELKKTINLVIGHELQRDDIKNIVMIVKTYMGTAGRDEQQQVLKALTKKLSK